MSKLPTIHDIALEAGRAARTRGAAATTGADVEAALLRRRTLQGVNARRVREAVDAWPVPSKRLPLEARRQASAHYLLTSSAASTPCFS